MILVTGANGHLGFATIQHLIKKTNKENIVALVRSEEKAQELKAQEVQVRIGSFDDVVSLDKAMEGIDQVLLISGVDPTRFQQHKNVIDAAERAGVNQIVYTSVNMKDVSSSVMKEFMVSHFETEEYIKQRGIGYTILRNTLYLDGILFFIGEHALENGFSLPAGSGKVPYALRDEMAEAAAVVLTNPGHVGKTYTLTGSGSHSYVDVAQVLSNLTGKSIAYTDASEETFAAQLAQSGAPEIVVYLLNGFSIDIKHDQYELESPDLELLLGRKPASLQEGLQRLL